MGATDVQDGASTEATMKAVVVYDDFELVGNATALLDLLSPLPDQTLQWVVRSYQFAQLKHAAGAKAAWVEAADADLIAVAMNNRVSLPCWIANWLETWAMRRQVKDPTFLVLSGGSKAGHSPAGVQQLCRFASRHGLACVCEDEFSADEEKPGCVGGDIELVPQFG
jgi:hypothetical protein